LTEALVLTFPNEPRFFALARLVLTGLAAQLDLPYEQVDDLELAVEGALAGYSSAGDEVTLRIEPAVGALAVLISPAGDARVAAALVDAAEVVTLEGREWLRLEKQVAAIASDT
jgi:anti-sigma regulatory factor (Ser/Thr protein kinase)